MKFVPVTVVVSASFLVGFSYRQVDRFTKMKQLESYVGTWNLSGKILMPD